MVHLKNLSFSFLVFVSFPSLGQIAEKPIFQFGIIADVQYCDCDNSGTRYYRQSPDKLKEAVAEFNRNGLAFAASLGDFIDRDFESFEVVDQIAKQLEAPLWHAVGNHEWSVEDALKSQVSEQLNVENRYYSKSLMGWRFIFLDGNAVSLFGTTKGSKQHQKAQKLLQSLEQQEAPNAKSWNGALGAKQLRWVMKELKSAKRAHEQVIFFCHFPVIPTPEVHNLWDDTKLLKIISKHDHVVAYFNGHVHKGGYEEVDKVHYLVFEGMVEKDTNAFAIVSVFKDRLEVKGFGRESDRVLQIN